jgi:hypothetical protein
MPPDIRSRVRRRQFATAIIASAVAAGLVAVSVVAIGTMGRDRSQPGPVPASPVPTSAPEDWSPVQERDDVIVQAGGTWKDPHDTPVGWIDVERLTADGDFVMQPQWSLQLTARPPLAADLKPGRLIAYGLVLETNGDNVADYLVGIDNSAPRPDDFRVWVTNLATGETIEQVGAPYGVPIEFSHPDEWLPGDGAQAKTTMSFTFLGGTEPAGFSPHTVRFYAWASETRDGAVVAWDTAPDSGWMTGVYS